MIFSILFGQAAVNYSTPDPDTVGPYSSNLGSSGIFLLIAMGAVIWWFTKADERNAKKAEKEEQLFYKRLDQEAKERSEKKALAEKNDVQLEDYLSNRTKITLQQYDDELEELLSMCEADEITKEEFTRRFRALNELLE